MSLCASPHTIRSTQNAHYILLFESPWPCQSITNTKTTSVSTPRIQTTSSFQHILRLHLVERRHPPRKTSSSTMSATYNAAAANEAAAYDTLGHPNYPPVYPSMQSPHAWETVGTVSRDLFRIDSMTLMTLLVIEKKVRKAILGI